MLGRLTSGALALLLILGLVAGAVVTVLYALVGGALTRLRYRRIPQDVREALEVEDGMRDTSQLPF